MNAETNVQAAWHKYRDTIDPTDAETAFHDGYRIGCIDFSKFIYSPAGIKAILDEIT